MQLHDDRLPGTRRLRTMQRIEDARAARNNALGMPLVPAPHVQPPTISAEAYERCARALTGEQYSP